MSAGCAGSITDMNQQVTLASRDNFRVPVRSMLERKFLTVIKQQYDFSCGSAALSSLLSFHYDMPTPELRSFQGMWYGGDQVQIKRAGFSMLDMKRYLGSRSIAANGFQVPLEKITEVGIPGIVLINVSGYKHFVVLKGVDKGEVLLGDPATGIAAISVAEFMDAWNGVFFVITEGPSLVTPLFNADQDWQLINRARITYAQRPLSQQALNLILPQVGLEF
ncbi:MAG: C39 family peptidase [Pseudomonadota bacterium]